MPRVAELTDLDERIIAEAVAWYGRIPVSFNAVDRRVVAKALRIAGGDWHRIVIDSPESVTVHNHPMW